MPGGGGGGGRGREREGEGGRGREREGGGGRRISTVSLNTLRHVFVEGATHMLCIEVEFHHWMVRWAGRHGKHTPLLHSPGELIRGGHHSQFQFHFITADWEWGIKQCRV